MGLALEFYIGDADAIASAIQGMDLEQLDDVEVVAARADLSLHLLPKDLNYLSRAIGNAAGVPPIDLRSYLHILLDTADYGLLAVDPTWVAYVAMAPIERAAAIAADWADQMQQEYSDPALTATDAMVLAVEELIRLCVMARNSRVAVLHAWFL
jgi:hypothetical protein